MVIHQQLALKLVDTEDPYYKYILALIKGKNRASLYWVRPLIMNRTFVVNKPNTLLIDLSKSRAEIVYISIPLEGNFVIAEKYIEIKYLDMAPRWSTHET